MKPFEIPLPQISLHNGDTLRLSWTEHGEGEVELTDHRVTPSPEREAAEVALLEQTLAEL